ncbi:MAG: hypothetical protein U0599_06000 [Vicinamibacteria bacterium]
MESVLLRRMQTPDVPQNAARLRSDPIRTPGPPADSLVDVYEAHWVDLMPEQAELGPWTKLQRGLELLIYWLLDRRIWRAFLVSKYMTFGLVAGGALLLIWYVGVAVLALSAVGSDPTLSGPARELPVVGAVVAVLVAVAGSIGEWRYWALLSLLVPLFRVDLLARIAYFTKALFENTLDESGVGLRDRVRERIRPTLEAVLQEDYDEVVVAAHSLGTVFAVDLLADWPHTQDFDRLSLVTLGSPRVVLRLRSAWLDEQLETLLSRPELVRWLDFFARTDWLCGAVPGHSQRYGAGHQKELVFEASLPQRLTARTHLLYYQDRCVLNALAGAP